MVRRLHCRGPRFRDIRIQEAAMRPNRFPPILASSLVLVVALAGCSSERRLPLAVTDHGAPNSRPATHLDSSDDPTVSPVLQSMNSRLAALGLNIRATKAEY